MSFEQLPNKLIVKIFRCLLDDPVVFKRLRETCKRFNDIVNDELLTIQDKQFPVLQPWMLEMYYGYTLDFMYGLEYPGCHDCREIQMRMAYEYVKFRRLALIAPGACCLDTLRVNCTNLDRITELNLAGSQDVINAIALASLLQRLCNVKRLSLWVTELSETNSGKRVPYGLLIRRDMVCINLDGAIDESLSEYLINQLPTERLTIFIRDEYLDLWANPWIERYVTTHKSILKECNVTVNETYYPEKLTRRVRAFIDQSRELLSNLGYECATNIDHIEVVDDPEPLKVEEQKERDEQTEKISDSDLEALLESCDKGLTPEVEKEILAFAEEIRFKGSPGCS